MENRHPLNPLTFKLANKFSHFTIQKARPWAKNSSPNTNDLYIQYMGKSTGTPPSLEEKMHFQTVATKKWMYIKIVFPPLLQQFLSVWNDCISYVQVIGVWWLVCGSFKVTPEVFSCFLQTSQVLPHWLNHHFSLILVLYTETLSC